MRPCGRSPRSRERRASAAVSPPPASPNTSLAIHFQVAQYLPLPGLGVIPPDSGPKVGPRGAKPAASTKEDISAASNGTQAKLGKFLLERHVFNADFECEAGWVRGCHQQPWNLSGFVSHLHRGHCGSAW